MVEKFKIETHRINGYLKEIVTFLDDSGKPVSQVINPLMVELKPRDAAQIAAGAFLISTPLSFTEEVWTLSTELSDLRVCALFGLSLVSVVLFIYYNFYRFRIKGNVVSFIKRLVATYLISYTCISLILSLIDKFPILDDPKVAINRLVIISFPALFGGVISDILK